MVAGTNQNIIMESQVWGKGEELLGGKMLDCMPYPTSLQGSFGYLHPSHLPLRMYDAYLLSATYFITSVGLKIFTITIHSTASKVAGMF